MSAPLVYSLLYAIIEISISTFLRAKNSSSATDKGSFRLIWIVINVSLAVAILAFFYLPQASFAPNALASWLGTAFFFVGLTLRLYSIFYLGRFFTVQVSVAADQRVIDSGPYKFIRHPSYTGVLLAFFGLGLSFENFVTWALFVIPTTVVFLYRIRVEESVLLAGLGEPYRQYMSRTRRLIPFLY